MIAHREMQKEMHMVFIDSEKTEIWSRVFEGVPEIKVGPFAPRERHV